MIVCPLLQAQVLDLDRLLRWAVRCQVRCQVACAAPVPPLCGRASACNHMVLPVFSVALLRCHRIALMYRPCTALSSPQGAVEGGFMGRTNKLVDGCYSFWQAGAFPLLAALLKKQQGQQPGVSEGKEPAPAAADDATAAAATRIAALLLGDSGKAAASGGGGSSSDGSSSEGGEGDTLTEFIADLPTLTPLEAAQRRRAELQRQLDAAVEASIDAEDRYRAAAGVAAGGPLQQEALAALERASDLQKVRDAGGPGAAWTRASNSASVSAVQCFPTQPSVNRLLPFTLLHCYVFLQALETCQQHEQAVACGAATLLDNAPHHGISTGSSGSAEQEDRLPLLYDAPALQLWLLKCCQAVSGGVPLVHLT